MKGFYLHVLLVVSKVYRYTLTLCFGGEYRFAVKTFAQEKENDKTSRTHVMGEVLPLTRIFPRFQASVEI